MLALNLSPDTVCTATAEQAVGLTGVDTGCGGITYPVGGWLYPQQLIAELLTLAVTYGPYVRYGYHVETLSTESDGWLLSQQYSHQAVVLANSHSIADLTRTAQLPVYLVGGQVSHIPTTPQFPAPRQVLCYDDYLTPCNPQDQQHCVDASYHRGETNTAFSEEDQQHNRQRLIDCSPNAGQTLDMDINANATHYGVHYATRDHLPMVGNVPDYEATLTQYANLREQLDHTGRAPVCHNLFMLEALGSRGLCTTPLSARLLATQMSGEPLPLDNDILAALSPNRLWVRRLLRGKAVKQNHEDRRFPGYG